MARAEPPLAAQIIALSPSCPPLLLRTLRPQSPPLPVALRCSRVSPTTRGRERIYPPKRGTIEDEKGGRPRLGICISNDTRA
eukprot:5324022-Pyramimonas_sp.AAC.1